MKNIVKVIRHGTEKPRLYALPDDVSVKAGTLVSVEAPNSMSTMTGVTVSDSYVVDGDTEKMVIDLLHFIPATFDSLKRVVGVYAEQPVMWPEASQPDTDNEQDGEPEDE